MASGSEIGAKGPVVLWVSQDEEPDFELLYWFREEELWISFMLENLKIIPLKSTNPEEIVSFAQQNNVYMIVPALPLEVVNRIAELCKPLGIKVHQCIARALAVGEDLDSDWNCWDCLVHDFPYCNE